MTLIEEPGFGFGNPHQIHLVEDNPERSDGAFEHRRIRFVKRKAFGFQQFTRRVRFFLALFGKVNVLPARKPIFLVPLAFAVSD